MAASMNAARSQEWNYLPNEENAAVRRDWTKSSNIMHALYFYVFPRDHGMAVSICRLQLMECKIANGAEGGFEQLYPIDNT